LFISSESAINNPRRDDPLRMTKTAQALRVSRGLAQLLPAQDHGDAVLPFQHIPPVWRNLPGRLSAETFCGIEAEFFKTVRPSSLLNGFATTEEVANLVIYVAAHCSAATNGAALRVDGGSVQACF